MSLQLALDGALVLPTSHLIDTSITLRIIHLLLLLFVQAADLGSLAFANVDDPLPLVERYYTGWLRFIWVGVVTYQ